MLYVLPVIFAAVAMLYAMAGFGGGSTYIALLVVSGLPLAVVPVIALTCNLVVSTQGSVLLIRRGHADWFVLVPLLCGSVPSAFIGGAWKIEESLFVTILAFALMVAGIAMLVQGKAKAVSGDDSRSPSRIILVLTGTLLGVLAGVTGIGGGIYLAPVMHLLRWSKAHSIAACTSLFIALNSASGLAGQITKGIADYSDVHGWFLFVCPIAVLFGGRVGSGFLVAKLRTHNVRMLTAVVVLLISIRLWYGIIFA